MEKKGRRGGQAREKTALDKQTQQNNTRRTLEMDDAVSAAFDSGNSFSIIDPPKAPPPPIVGEKRRHFRNLSRQGIASVFIKVY